MSNFKISGNLSFSSGKLNSNPMISQIVNGILETNLNAGFSSTDGTQGALSLSNGLVIRWGRVANVSQDAGNPTKVTFVNPYKINCIGVTISNARTFTYVASTKTHLNLALKDGGFVCAWIAIGY